MSNFSDTEKSIFKSFMKSQELQVAGRRIDEDLLNIIYRNKEIEGDNALGVRIIYKPQRVLCIGHLPSMDITNRIAFIIESGLFEKPGDEAK